MAKKFTRRKYFIEKHVQGKFMLRFVIMSVLGVLIAIVAFNFLSHKKLDGVLYAMRLPEASTGGILLYEMVYAILISIVFIVVSFLITAKRLFAKINGPLLKLASDIRKIALGDLSATIQLRRNDEFQSFAGDLNNMVVELNGRFANIKRHAYELSALAKAAQEAPDTVDQRITEKIAELEEELRAFKI